MCIEFLPYAFILHMFRKTYFNTSSLYINFCFYQKLFWYLLSKVRIFHLLCVLDSIHTHYTSNVFQISYFYIYTSFRKIIFSFQSLIFENIVLDLSFNSYTSKIVHMFVICVDFWSHIFGLQYIYMNLFCEIYGVLLEFIWVSKSKF